MARKRLKLVGIYMEPALHKQVKAAAAASGVSMSAYVVARLFATSGYAIIGDIPSAPLPLKP